MEIGDKIKVQNIHSFYDRATGRIVDYDVTKKAFLCHMDVDNKNVYVAEEHLALADQNHDAHYRKLVVQPIEIAFETFTPEEFRGAMKFQILKYGMRAGLKDGENEDKEKAKRKRYSAWLKEYTEKGTITL